MTQSYEQGETFRPVGCLVRTTMTNGLLLFVPLALLTWFICTAILGALGLPVAWLFGLVLGGAVSAALFRARTRKLQAQVSDMTLTFDPHGITQEDPVATRFVSWEGLRGGRLVQPVVGMSTGKLARGGRRSRTPGIDALASAAAARELGLVGIGVVTLASTAGAMQRETFKQNETRNGVDPATGQPLVALYPLQFDPSWPDGPIGEWVRHFRPDVYAEAKALWDQQARNTSLNVREMWQEAKESAQEQAPPGGGSAPGQGESKDRAARP